MTPKPGKIWREVASLNKQIEWTVKPRRGLIPSLCSAAAHLRRYGALSIGSKKEEVPYETSAVSHRCAK
jgi:hypothetical protein